jgi:hypothetical protein
VPIALGPGGRIHFIASQYIYPNGYGIVYYRSKDCGSSWDDTCVSYCDGLNRNAAAIALGGGNVHVLWQDYEYGNYDMFYRRGMGLGGVDEDGDTRAVARPAGTASAWPNPVAAGTTLRYCLNSGADVTLSVSDINGRDVWSQHVGQQEPGYHQQKWSGCDRNARRVPPGCYFLAVRADSRSTWVKLLVVSSSGATGQRPR